MRNTLPQSERESERAGIPPDAISAGAKVNVKQQIYSRLQSKQAPYLCCMHEQTVLKQEGCCKQENENPFFFFSL